MLKNWFIILILATHLSSFANDPFPSGRIIENVVCKSDPAQSYALYIPLKGNKEALPVVYFFDPHGAGSLPLKKYRSLADIYGFIIVGSNNSKNGNDWTITENTWRHLFGDTKNRLNIDSRRLYTCGFSGGAKVAGYVAIQHPGIRGVIAGGAGLPDGISADNFPFSFTALAGEGDMNLTELVAISNDLDRTRTRHRLILFDGKHEWAPETVMDRAFAGWQFDAMRDALIPKDNKFIGQYIAKSKARTDAYYKSDQLIKAAEECRLSIALLDGLTAETGWFRQRSAELAGDPRYQKQKQAQEAILVKEQNTKAGYMQHFQDDERFWTGTINELEIKAKAKTMESAMYQRLLAYLSLAFYSFSNRLINSNENAGARHYVELYKKADPTNSEAWYFSALLHARAGETQAAENDLLKAVQNGFRDKDRLTQQPEFKRIDLRGIENKIPVH